MEEVTMEGRKIWGEIIGALITGIVFGIIGMIFGRSEPKRTQAAVVPNPQADPVGYAVWTEQARIVQQAHEKARQEAERRASMELRERLHMGATKVVGDAAAKGADLDPKSLYEASYDNAVRLGLVTRE
jgi:Mg2+/citrate symporter